jgi:hypothetical protein
MLAPRVGRWCVALLLFATGCATSNAPAGWRPELDEALGDPYGSWVTMEYGGEDRLEHSVSGELIAISPDTLYVLDGRVLRTVAATWVEKATVEWFEPNTKGMEAAVVLGTLSTASHGFGLVFTAPGWILLGSTATGAYTHEPIVTFPKHPLSTLQEYARFPQGLPEGLDRAHIAPRRFTPKPKRSSQPSIWSADGN